MSKTKTWWVACRVICAYEVPVEASSLEEANQKIEDLYYKGADFDLLGFRDSTDLEILETLEDSDED